MIARVQEILAKKGRHVVSVSPEATVRAAVATMIAERVGSVLVIDSGRLSGLFSERHCIERVVLEGRDPAHTCVGDVMVAHILTVESTDTIERCMALMTAKRTRHLIVVDGGELEGLVSIGDCVAHLCEVATNENRILLEYITGCQSR